MVRVGVNIFCFMRKSGILYLWKVVKKHRKRLIINILSCFYPMVRPTGIEPVLRASEARILSVGRRSRCDVSQ